MVYAMLEGDSHHFNHSFSPLSSHKFPLYNFLSQVTHLCLTRNLLKSRLYIFGFDLITLVGFFQHRVIVFYLYIDVVVDRYEEIDDLNSHRGVELANGSVDIGNFDFEDADVLQQSVSEQSRLEVDPVLYVSQRDSSEYRAHPVYQQRLDA